MGFQPLWQEYEDKLSSRNSEEAEKAGEAFEKERQKELLNSPKAREWEARRKEEWAKAKPEHVKKRMEQAKRNDPALKTLENLRDMGSFQEEIIPSPGFVLIDVDTPETKTPTGYELPQTNDDTPNTGTVVSIGETLITPSGVILAFPHPLGSRVIFGKYTPNLHVNIKGHRYYFMSFEQVLGRFK